MASLQNMFQGLDGQANVNVEIMGGGLVPGAEGSSPGDGTVDDRLCRFGGTSLGRRLDRRNDFRILQTHLVRALSSRISVIDRRTYRQNDGDRP